MSRPLKFRAWDDGAKEWLFGYAPGKDHMAFHLNGEVVAMGELGAFVAHNISRLDEITFEQFTGLTDKNGVEIYDGDVVKFRDVDFESEVFSDAFAKVEFRNGAFTTDADFRNFIGGASSYEVVGNIHQHPDLLESAE